MYSPLGVQFRPGLLTKPWAVEAKAEATEREAEAEASCHEAKVRFSGLEAEAFSRI